MAILISKSKAQNKGAMTRQATANSTFIASLFILEDTMKQETCLKHQLCYSRRKARKLFKEKYCSNLPSDIVVHHEDHNPFNNNLDNLEPMELDSHTSYHASKDPGWGRRVDVDELLRKLEGRLIIFNDR